MFCEFCKITSLLFLSCCSSQAASQALPATDTGSRTRTIFASNSSLHENLSNELTIRHGDKNECEASSLLINLFTPSTSVGERLPPPWAEQGELSSLHIARAGNLKIQFKSKAETIKVDGTSKIVLSEIPTGEYIDNPVARFQRLQDANEDARNLHLKSVQKGSGPVDFSTLLEEANLNSTEVVKHVINCKCILNLNNFGNSTHDIMGDCKLIMTEIIRGDAKHRRIYFFQVQITFWPKAVHCSLLNRFCYRLDLNLWS